MGLQIRFFAAAFFCALAYAQNPQRVDVSAPQNQVVAGDTIQLTAVARDSAGNVLPNAAFTWSSTNQNIARVDGQGRLTAAPALGMVTVSARSGNVQGALTVQILPLRIDMEPSTKEMEVGERLQFRATARDLNGEAIPNVNFNWLVSGANGNQINAARIDQQGNFSAIGGGLITVRARFGYGSAPGRVEWVWGSATVSIRAHRDFSIRRILGPEDVRHSFELRPRTLASAAINERGQIAFPGALDGISTAMLFYDNGQLRILAQGGDSARAGTNALGITDAPITAALNNRGEVLTSFNVNPGNQVLALATPTGLSNIVDGGQPYSDLGTFNNFRVQRWSLNDSGEGVFSANLNLPSASTQALFRSGGGTVDLIATAPSVNISNFESFAIDAEGTIYFAGQTSAGRILYRVPRLAVPEKLLAERDAFDGSTVTGIGNPVPVKEGGIAVPVYLREGPSQILTIRGAQKSVIPAPGINRIEQAGDESGILFVANQNGFNSLMLWRKGATRQLLRQSQLASNGQPITQFYSAAIDASGTVTAHVSTAENELVLMRTAEPRPLILQGGDRVDVTAKPYLPYNNVLVKGGGAVNPLIQLGSPSSLFELDGNLLVPRVLVGDRLADGALVSGGTTFAGAPGELYFTTSNGIYRSRAGQIEPVVRNNDAVPGGKINFSSLMAVNARGAVVFEARIIPDAGGPFVTAVYLLREGRITEILRYGAAAGPRAQVFSRINDVSIEDGGRVWFRPSGPAPAVYSWQDGRIELVAEPGTNYDRQTLASFSPPRASGDAVYFTSFARVCCEFWLFSVNQGGLNSLLRYADAMPEGSELTSVGRFDANRSGSVAFVAQGNGTSSFVARMASGETKLVHQFNSLTDEGYQLARVEEIDYRDDGRIFFTAFDVEGTYAVYAAEPR